MGRIYRGFELYNEKNKIIVVAFVDSGSDNTILSKRAAKKLKIRPMEKEELEVANRGTIMTDVGTVRIVSEEDKIDDVIRVNITDVPFEMDSDENIDMIIGLDFMQKHNIRLSFRKRWGVEKVRKYKELDEIHKIREELWRMSKKDRNKLLKKVREEFKDLYVE